MRQRVGTPRNLSELTGSGSIVAVDSFPMGLRSTRAAIPGTCGRCDGRQI